MRSTSPRKAGLLSHPAHGQHHGTRKFRCACVTSLLFYLAGNTTEAASPLRPQSARLLSAPTRSTPSTSDGKTALLAGTLFDSLPQSNCPQEPRSAFNTRHYDTYQRIECAGKRVVPLFSLPWATHRPTSGGTEPGWLQGARRPGGHRSGEQSYARPLSFNNIWSATPSLLTGMLCRLG